MVHFDTFNAYFAINMIEERNDGVLGLFCAHCLG